MFQKSRFKKPPYLGEKNLARDKYKKPDRLLQNPDAIVIGSGIGGLAMASILAQRKRWRVLLLEGNKVPGVCTHCHEMEGFEFNSGVDSIGDMDPSVGRGLFRRTIDFVTAGTLEWAKMPDVHETCCFGDDIYEWYSSPEKNIAWVEEKFPGQGDVRRYYDLEESIEWWAWSWGLTKLWPAWVPVEVRERMYQLTGGNWRKYMLRTTEDVFKNELGFSDRLANVFSYMYGNHGRTPGLAPFAFHAMNLFHYRYGAYYPVGGPAQIAECVVPIVEAAGGQLAVSSRVQRILVQGNTAVGVELEDGQVVRAPVIISDASAYTTLMELLPRDVADKHGYPELFTEIRPSVAHLYLVLGYDEAIDIPKHIVWHMPTYEGIDQYDLETADIHYKKDRVFEGMGGYLLSPSARDPVYAERYPNRSTVIVLAEAPYPWVERCKNDPEYRDSFDKDLADNLEKLVHRHFPVLADKTPVLRKAGVPMGCNPWAWEACSLGLEPSGDRFVKHTHWLRPETAVKNLWLTGQDSFSPGFAGSMASARITYSAMTGNWPMMLRNTMGRFP